MTTPPSCLAARGFTLLELLVVLFIMALATAGVSLALPGNGATHMQREGERLAALLEAGRAHARASGRVVRWRAHAQGFDFAGLPPDSSLPGHWLHAATGVREPKMLWLGPEPLIGPQQVIIVNPQWPQQAVRVATDGLRPFSARLLQ